MHIIFMWESLRSNYTKDLVYALFLPVIRNQFTSFSQNYRLETETTDEPQMPLDESAVLKHLVSKEFDV
jgi:hypothetical protein